MNTAWAQVRSDTNDESTYLLATYNENSKTDVTLYDTGPGGIESACRNLPNDKPMFGGVRLSTGRFVSFIYIGDEVGIMLRGRSSMHKNGVLNVLQGCDEEIEVWKNMTEEQVGTDKPCGEDDNLTVVPSFVEKGKSKTYMVQGNGKDFSSSHHKVNVAPPTATNIDNIDNNNSKTQPCIIPYETLKNIADSTSLGIDPKCKELALCDEEFQNIFQMSKESFASLASWKKTQLKKAASLF